MSTHWRLTDRLLGLDRPIVVGILNVTPDSFSDGGRFADAEAAVAQAARMVEEGADMIDVGGESTRPGAQPVDAATEASRVVPVIAAVRRRWPEIAVSVDTVKAAVAGAALDAGAQAVNDVSGGRIDPAMTPVIAGRGAGFVVMHSRGEVADMARYDHAEYGDDAVGEVLAELGARVDAALAAGVARDAIVVDPGIGFAKRPAHSLALLAATPRLCALGHPVLVGVSRKRFVGELTGEAQPDARVHGTTGANVAALMLGARLFRVHDVRAARQALDVAWAVVQAAAPGVPAATGAPA